MFLIKILRFASTFAILRSNPAAQRQPGGEGQIATDGIETVYLVVVHSPRQAARVFLGEQHESEHQNHLRRHP